MGCCNSKQEQHNIICDNCYHQVKDYVEFYSYMGNFYFFCSEKCYNEHHYRTFHIKDYSIIDLNNKKYKI